MKIMYCFRYNDDKYSDNLNFTIEGWVTPEKENVEGYDRIISNINNDINKILYNNKQNLGIKKYLTVFEVKLSGIKYNKMSYMSCDVFINYEKEPPYMFLELLNNYFKENEYFKFVQNKKDLALS